MIRKEKTILVIEDDVHMRRVLKDNLEFEGYNVLTVNDGETGLAYFARFQPDLVLLDIMLPGLGGIEVCARVRAQESYIPIIMISARGSEVDKVLGLEIGADDYVTKPFGVQELIARIKALLRRFEIKLHGLRYQIGDFVIRFDEHLVMRGDEVVDFTTKELELLNCFVQNEGKVLSREHLLATVWGVGGEKTTRTVDNHVLKLRKKLEVSPQIPRLIITHYGVGYKFVGMPQRLVD
ncbi:MAG TPA: DNA-binding response regulator [Gammaproteobacteria bacterium]|jgi:DNA-binding response OmpR family regulator|nr:DNA-binding response regulator [Gammaproteobacteria bacterium]